MIPSRIGSTILKNKPLIKLKNKSLIQRVITNALKVTPNAYVATDSEQIKDNVNKKEKSIIFSFLHNALNLRREKCNKPITLLCCDNIRENGKMLQDCLKQYLSASKEYELLEWIEENVSFPSCVVDRITPRTPEFLKSEIMEKFNWHVTQSAKIDCNVHKLWKIITTKSNLELFHPNYLYLNII